MCLTRVTLDAITLTGKLKDVVGGSVISTKTGVRIAISGAGSTDVVGGRATSAKVGVVTTRKGLTG